MEMTNQRGKLVAKLRTVTVYRNPVPSEAHTGAPWHDCDPLPNWDDAEAIGDTLQAAGAAADQPPHARALLRRLRRPQPDPRRHRLRQKAWFHGRRVRPRHAVDGLPWPPRHLMGAPEAGAWPRHALHFDHQVGDVITVSGKVTGKREKDGETLVDLEVKCTNQNGQDTLQGTATVALN
jgi:hypothetical protein